MKNTNIKRQVLPSIVSKTESNLDLYKISYVLRQTGQKKGLLGESVDVDAYKFISALNCFDRKIVWRMS